MQEFKCAECGEVIPPDNIDYSNKCNDEGEDYHEVTAWCPNCKKDHEANGWGECADTDDAIGSLIQYYGQ